jgi:archaellum component FlaF (FlaF/FlaG flagellin family)
MLGTGAATTAFAIALVGVSTPANAATGTTRISSTSTGAPANDTSLLPGLSDDGRYATFNSTATNLVPGDPSNFSQDVFLKDRATGAVDQISVNSQGVTGNNFSGGFSTASPVTPDGRFVAFDSFASNLVPGDTNQLLDTFLRDRQSRTTVRLDVSSTGAQSTNSSAAQAISADGRYVLFISRSTNLVPGDSNNALDGFIRDTVLSTTTRVTVKADGTQVTADTRAWDLSNDGRFMVFGSVSSYTADDTNADDDAYVKDLRTGSVERVSLTNAGRDFPGGTSFQRASISADGRFVAFNAAQANQLPQIWVRDRLNRTTTLVSVNLGGQPGNRSAMSASISPNGRYVSFITTADNMVSPAPTPFAHVYVRDLQTGRTTLASVTSAGAPIPQSSNDNFMSNVGVAFDSFYSRVVPDGNDKEQAYIHLN